MLGEGLNLHATNANGRVHLLYSHEGVSTLMLIIQVAHTILGNLKSGFGISFLNDCFVRETSKLTG